MRTIYTIFTLVLTFCALSFVFAKNPLPSTFEKGNAKHQHTSLHFKNEQLGQLKKVEDAGYPLVVLTFELAQGGVETLNLNLEEVKTFNAQKLNQAIGKEFAFNFTSETTNALLDIRRDGKSIVGGNVKLKPGIKKIKGILSNAEHETTGDLPDELMIQTVEEIKLSFPYFITKKIVAANGKNVIGYYEERTIKTITSLKLTGE